MTELVNPYNSNFNCRAYADSKTLTDEKREHLYGEMEAAGDIGFAVDRIAAAEISSQMLRRYGCMSPAHLTC